MELICSNCTAAIKPVAINVDTDLAKCDACGHVHRASQLVASAEVDNLRPPADSDLDLTVDEDGRTVLTIPPPKWTADKIWLCSQ